jgi:tRNA(Ile)-lysidine synthase
MPAAAPKPGQDGLNQAPVRPRLDPAVRSIVSRWRRLTGKGPRGQRTLLACSAGADSSGLVLALTSAIRRPAETFVVAHIVHDLRPRPEALADRDAAATLAERLGLPFVEAEITVSSSKGNREGLARTERYRVLSTLAAGAGCPYIATAHHADDQLETILMGLVRGAGPAGLRGVSARRSIKGAATIIRPALGVTHSDLQRICTGTGWAWREDITNKDATRVRAALRHDIIPRLEALRPGVARRASRSARLLGQAQVLVDQGAAALRNAARSDADGWVILRSLLRAQPEIVVVEFLRSFARDRADRTGLDRLGAAHLDPVLTAIMDDHPQPRTFQWPCATITVTAREVTIRRSM